MAAITTLLLRWAGGWAERTLGTSPRCEARLDTGAQASLAAVYAVADAQLAAYSAVQRQVEFNQVNLAGSGTQPYVDYRLGDLVYVPQNPYAPATGGAVPRRVASISIAEDNDTGSASITPTVLTPGASPGPVLALEPEAALFQNNKKMTNGTFRGQSRVAQPAVPHSLGPPVLGSGQTPGLLFDSFNFPDERASAGTDLAWINHDWAGNAYGGDLSGVMGADDGVIAEPTGTLTLDGGESNTVTGGGSIVGRQDRVTVKELGTDAEFAKIYIGHLDPVTIPTATGFGIGLRCSTTPVMSPSGFGYGMTAGYPGFWCDTGFFFDYFYNTVGIYRVMNDGTPHQLEVTVSGPEDGSGHPLFASQGDYLRFTINEPGSGGQLRAYLYAKPYLGTPGSFGPKAEFQILATVVPLVGAAGLNTEPYAGRHAGFYLGMGDDGYGYPAPNNFPAVGLDNFTAQDIVT